MIASANIKENVVAPQSRVNTSFSPAQLPDTPSTRQAMAPAFLPVQPIQQEAIKIALEHLNQQVQKLHHNLRFSVHEGTGRTIVQVIDTQTQEVIRQFPSEEILHLNESLLAYGGVLLDTEA